MTTPTADSPMTFLQLCQRTAKECGVGSASVQMLPSTVVGQVGELSRVVDYVQQSWTELQGNRRWSFLWEVATITIPASASSVAQGVSADRYDVESAYVPVVTSDGRHMDYLPWDEFRTMYPRLLTGSSLGVWTVAPDRSVRINGIAPPTGHVFTVERFAMPTKLRLDTDVPPIDADLHMLIVYMAVRKYGGFDEAGTQYKLAAAEEARMRHDFVARYTVAPRLGGTLFDQYL
jgi:hypothetical protein